MSQQTETALPQRLQELIEQEEEAAANFYWEHYDLSESLRKVALRALEHGRAQAPAPDWQPKPAPKDGRWFWLIGPKSERWPNGRVSAFKWDEERGHWFAGTGWWHQIDHFYTHWAVMEMQPPALPAPPSTGAPTGDRREL